MVRPATPATGRGSRRWEVDRAVVGFGPTGSLAWLAARGAHADSVELKTLLVPPAGAAAEALTGRRAPTWSVRQTYLLDTAGLEFLRVGVEIRLRRRARGRFDLAVSTQRRPAAREAAVPRGARVEFDVVPGAMWRDVEVRREVEAATAAAVIAGSAKARELLSGTQCGWACSAGTAEVDDARLSELRVYGPLVVRRVKVSAAGLGLGRADLEHFRFPSGRELVELSTRCDPQDGPAVAAAFEQLLAEREVTVAPRWCTKTAVWRAELS